MTEDASHGDTEKWTFSEEELRHHPSHPRFSLRAYVERERALMRANGAPTMAEWLEDARSSGPLGVTGAQAAEALREARAERDERVDTWLA